MTDHRKIRNLITLLDAESEEVRESVREALQGMGEDLSAFMEAFKPEFSPETMYVLHEIQQAVKTRNLRSSWLDWMSLEGEYLRLEAAMASLAEIQTTQNEFPPLSDLLDGLVGDFLESGHDTDVLALNRFLFGEGRLRGAVDDYYHPLNSNLCHVITHGEGLPISLAVVLMLTGNRLGLEIKGFNLPGHFLTQTMMEGKSILIDCYSGGKVLSHHELSALSLSSRVNLFDLFQHAPTALDIVLRVLFNLINAYYRSGAIEDYHLMQELLVDLQRRKDPAVETTPLQPIFKPGSLVRHKRYGYRGVVVDFDTHCRADDDWYRANRTQPNKKQPWYHVLVDRSTATTYAAQSNLKSDMESLEIRHPLVPVYFLRFDNGGYVRNDVPWIITG